MELNDDALDFAEFQRQQAEYEKKKENADSLRGVVSGLGGMLQAEANVPSAYEYLYNKKIAPTDFQGSADRAAKLVQDPTNPAEREQKAMAYLKAKREGRAAEREEGIASAEQDANSADSLAMQEQIAGVFPQYKKFVTGKSKAQIKELMPLLSKKIEGDNARQNALISAGGKEAERERERKKDEMNLTNIPLEDREIVKGLAQRNAIALAIANDIETTKASWKNMSESEKLASMNGLIKGLNSKYGNDAVGAEEVRRLSPKLQFAFGNFTNDNPTQFGRDLPGFEKDAENSATNLRKLVAENEAEIARRKGQLPKVATPQVAGVTDEKQKLKLAIADEKARRERLKNTASNK